MIHPIPCLGLAALLIGGAGVWHRHDLRRRLADDRACRSRTLARDLMDAATRTAEVSEAAGAALTVLAEVVQGTVGMSVLEAAVLAERVREGARLDERRARETLLLRQAALLQGIVAARELVDVMLPETRRDRSIRNDALAVLDAARRSFHAETPQVNNPANGSRTTQTTPNGGRA